MSQFAGQRYITLETYRRSGQGVKTTVLFVERGDKLYVRTFANSWKARRIRKNPKVRVSPSSARGEPKGSWVEATARLAEAEAYTPVFDLFRIKYGFLNWLSRLRAYGKSVVIFEVELNPSASSNPPIH